MATALATADPSNAIGEGISNAVAQAFGRVVSCDSSKENTKEPLGVSSLAVSVAVAIASTETAGSLCVAESDAVAEVVTDIVTQGVAGGLLENSDPFEQTLAEAWLVEETPALAARVHDGVDTALASGACTISGLQSCLATARDVGDALEDAISQILLAISCGGNVQTQDPEGDHPDGCDPSQGTITGEQALVVEAGSGVVDGNNGDNVDCRYDSTQRMFFGNCAPAKTPPRNCNQEYRDCTGQGRAVEVCHRELETCSSVRMTEVVARAVHSGEPQPEVGEETNESPRAGKRGRKELPIT